MSDRVRIEQEIAELEAEKAAIKLANPNWASDAGDKAAIAAKENRITALESQLTPAAAPGNTIYFFPPLVLRLFSLINSFLISFNWLGRNCIGCGSFLAFFNMLRRCQRC